MRPSLLAAALACVAAAPSRARQVPDRLQLRFDPSEAEAVLAIVAKHRAGRARLIECMLDPWQVLAGYNRAAAERNRGEFRVGMAELKSELLRWMFLFWVGTMGTVLAILKL